jgi:hypothetical protein
LVDFISGIAGLFGRQLGPSLFFSLTMSINTGGYWVSAKQVVYFKSVEIRGADGLSFQKLSETWAKDRKHVYSYGRRITKGDVNSFQVLNELYAKDKNHCYYLGGIIKGADAASFHVLDAGECLFEFRNAFGDHVFTRHGHQGYAADAKQVFYYVQTIDKPCVVGKADLASFQVLGCGYARDEQNVYYDTLRLKDADSRSFEVIPPLWGRDKKRVFYQGSHLSGADPQTFEILASHNYLSKDASHYYCRDAEIQRDQAFPHGSSVAGYPLEGVTDPTVAAEYLRRGATPHDPSVLSAACRKGDADMVRLLLNAGCKPRLADEGRNSCLTELFCKNYLEIAKLLIEAGADPNRMIEPSPLQHGRPIYAGISPLYHALWKNWFDLADYLISVGADINTTTDEGEPLTDYFRRTNNAAAVAYLLNKGA